MQVIGLLIIVVAAMGILALRRGVNKSGSTGLKTVVGVTDAYILLRFIGAILLIAVIMVSGNKVKNN